MRGINKNYNSQNDLNESKQVYLGRNRDLILQRNKALIARYYLFSVKTKVRYDEIITTLHNEFYISKATVIRIISDNLNELKELRNSNTSISSLKEFHPHFNWDIKGFLNRTN